MTPIKPPFYYRFLTNLLSPIYRQMVKKKSRHLPTLSRELAERFGEQYGKRPNTQRVIWCHAVSLGELNTAYPLLKRLLDLGFGLWISSTTQTGFNQAAKLFADEIKMGKVSHSFVPVDTVAVVERFLDWVRPEMALFVETELWANVLYVLAKRHIKSVMINARLTQKSYQGYDKFAKVSHSMMANLTKVIAQDKMSSDRFVQLGLDIDKITLSNSLKWVGLNQISSKNSELAKQITLQINPNPAKKRPIWVMASTHDGEEALALQTQKLLDEQALLILVPRHPERFDAVFELCQQSGLSVVRRSDFEPITQTTQVFLADSMGELMAWYQVCDVAVVGGSFVPKIGGHNPIEPASLAKPIVMGEYDANCQVLGDELAQVGALVRLSVANAPDLPNQLAGQLRSFFDNPQSAQQAGEQGRILTLAKQTAVDEQLSQILPLLQNN